MAPFPKTLKDYINVSALLAYTKTVEAEYFMLKALHEHLGISMGDEGKTTRKTRKRGPRGKVKAIVLAYLEKNRQGKAIEIAKLSGLKVTSVNQTLFQLKKSGHLKKGKKRGSPYVLAKK